VGKHLQQHLQLLLPVCTEIIKLATSIINSQAGSPDFHSQLEGERVKYALYKLLLVFFFSTGLADLLVCDFCLGFKVAVYCLT